MDTFNSATPRKSGPSESIIKEIKRQTRRRFNPEEKIRIVIDGLKGEASIAEICRKEGIHPQTQGKIERYHRPMENVILLDNYYAPSELEARIAEWVDYYNGRRVHESLGNVAPDDKYFGRADEIIRRRFKIKERTMRKRRRDYLMSA